MSLWFHVDMDAFYASVEQAANPEYRGRPVIIGAQPGKRGVVAACSYEARAYGVHSAMPVSQAYSRCPQAVYLPVRMSFYKEVSRKIMGIFQKYSPSIQEISIDEAFLDMTGTHGLYGNSYSAAMLIKKSILEETGLTVSIGVAPNRFLAKMASEFKKPNGYYEIEAGHEEAFIDSLHLKDLWGLGKKTYERLLELNLDSVGKLRSLPEPVLRSSLGKATGTFLYNAVRGIDTGLFERKAKSRSISSERTFGEDTKDTQCLSVTLLDLAEQIIFQLFDEGLKAKTLFIKIRYSDFTTQTAQVSLKHYITSSNELYNEALALLKKKYDFSTPLRLLGLGIQIDLDAADYQHELFDSTNAKMRKVEEAVISINKRLKRAGLTKASLIHKEQEDKKKYDF